MQVPSNNSALNEQNNNYALGNDNRRDDNDPTSPRKIVNSEGENEPLDDEDAVDYDDAVPTDDKDESLDMEADEPGDGDIENEGFDNVKDDAATY